MRLQDKVVVITGAGHGLGRESARLFASEGAKVVATDLVDTHVKTVADEIRSSGGEAVAAKADVTSEDDMRAAVQTAVDEFGRLDVMFCNAGIPEVGFGQVSFVDTTLENWNKVLAVNLTAPMLLTRACLPSMYEHGWGRVVNVASVAGKIGLKYGSAYSASKHGLVGFTRSLALEGAKKGVTANAICPSWTETRMMDEAVEAISLGSGRPEAEVRAAMLKDNPLGRAALPEEVADVAVFLVRNGAITGQAVHVDGGEVMA